MLCKLGDLQGFGLRNLVQRLNVTASAHHRNVRVQLFKGHYPNTEVVIQSRPLLVNHLSFEHVHSHIGRSNSFHASLLTYAEDAVAAIQLRQRSGSQDAGARAS